MSECWVFYAVPRCPFVVLRRTEEEYIKKKIVDAKVHRFECTRELYLADWAVKALEKHLKKKVKRWGKLIRLNQHIGREK